jgi:hypothetical protein
MTGVIAANAAAHSAKRRVLMLCISALLFCFAEADARPTKDIRTLSFTSAKFLRFTQRVAKTH